jgi:hypothetical protein
MDGMTTVSESQAANSHIAPTGWVIRGKWFVVPFVIVLCLLLALTLSMALQFQSIMQRLDNARTDWPAASRELEQRYAEFDTQFRNGTTMLGDADGKAWETEYSAFLETTQYDRQAKHAAQLERLLAKSQASPKTDSDKVPSESIVALVAAEQSRRDVEQSWIGRWTITALRLKLPETYSAGE